MSSLRRAWPEPVAGTSSINASPLPEKTGISSSSSSSILGIIAICMTTNSVDDSRGIGGIRPSRTRSQSHAFRCTVARSRARTPLALCPPRFPVLESIVCLQSSLLKRKTLPETIYDIAFIGSGPAGYTGAIRAGQYGLKTALIEKDGFLGGTCLHVGCIPTKALLFNAELWDHLKDAKEFGIEGVDARKLNWAAIQDRKSKIVTKHTKGLDFLMKKNKVETIRGYGKLTGPAQNGVHTVEINNDGKTTQLKAKKVILCTGSEARMLPGLEAGDRILSNIEILALKEIPKSLVIVGAGAVGVEFASIYRSFDCEVTIVEMLPRLVPVEDEEVSKELARVYRKRGINFHTSAKVEKVDKTKQASP